MFGNVVGDLALRHDGEFPFLANQLPAQVGAVGQHELHDVARGEQRGIRHLRRGHDGNAVGVDVLLVEGVQFERGGRRRHREGDVVLEQRGTGLGRRTLLTAGRGCRDDQTDHEEDLRNRR